MEFKTYERIFLEILDNPAPPKPYDQADYMSYARLNWSRQQRWQKTGVLNGDLIAEIKKIEKKQFWTIITEQWCGDAAHILPFIDMLAEYNSLIELDYQLRDTEPFLIDRYQTRGSKCIPKLIISDEQHHDLAVWGPRPSGCQVLYDHLTNEHADMEQKKIALQKWYNEDKGVSLQMELLTILSKIN